MTIYTQRQQQLCEHMMASDIDVTLSLTMTMSII